MASLSTRGGRYHIRFYDSSRSPKEAPPISLSAEAWTLTEARQYKKELEVEYEKGAFDPWTDRHPRENEATTMQAALEQFVEEKMARGRRGEPGGWAESTRGAYEATYEAFVDEVGPETSVEALRRAEVQAYVHQEGLAVATRRGYRSQLNCFLRWCDQQGWDVPEPLPPLQATSPTPAYLTEPELYEVCEAHVDRLLEVYETTKHVHRAQMMQQAWMTEAWRFLFYTGLRRGEMVRMRLLDVDTSDWTLHIREQKGGKESIIPVPPPAREVLVPFLTGEDGRKREGGYRPFYMRKEKQISRAFKDAVRYCEAISDPRRTERLKLHSLRHSAAVYWRRKGMALADIRDLLRHSSITTTEVYDKIIPSDLSERFETAADGSALENRW